MTDVAVTVCNYYSRAINEMNILKEYSIAKRHCQINHENIKTVPTDEIQVHSTWCRIEENIFLEYKQHITNFLPIVEQLIMHPPDKSFRAMQYPY